MAANPPPGPATLLSVSLLLDTLVVGSLWAVLPSLLRATEEAGRYGTIIGAANFLGLLSNAVFGALSDRYGRHTMFKLALLLFCACPVTIWLGLRWGSAPLVVIGGLLSRQQASHAIAKAYISDTSAAARRTATLARLASWSGAGFVVGPSLGGWLAGLDDGLAAMSVCAGLVLLNTLLSLVLLPRQQTGSIMQRKDTAASHAEAIPAVWALMSDPRVAHVLTLAFSLSFGFQAFTSVFAMYCKSRFGLDSAGFGNVLSFCGVVWATSQGVLIPNIKAYSGNAGLSDEILLRISTVLLLVGRLVQAAAYSLPLMLFGQLLVVSGAAFSFTLISSLLSQAVPSNSVGTILGASSAVEAFCGIVAPPLVGRLFEAYGDAAGPVVAACSNMLACMLVLVLPPASEEKGKVG